MNLLLALSRQAGVRRTLLLAAALSLAGCALPERPPRPSVYDFGPGPSASTAPVEPAQPPLALAEVEAAPALDGTAMLFRLGYADERESRPYAQSRWSMPPAQLVRQRLRARLGALRPVVPVGEAPASQTLRVEIEEFSQVFDAPDRSAALVRLRATLVDTTAPAAQRVRQRLFVVRRPAVSADAGGGVRAMAEATDAAVEEIAQWLAPAR